ncbi:MAG: peptidase dimerization domain-containing protein, partial [Herbiconiux sp.]|nr:peptidase dimerization domain-containing protein [Herbiconiux sp.]
AGLDAWLRALGVAGALVADGARSTATPTVLAAGGKANVIPSRAEARLDVRVLPGRLDAFRREIAELVGPEVTLEWSPVIPAVESPLDSPLLGVLAASVAAEDEGATLLPFQLPASTDAKHLAALGIRGYGFVPLRVPDRLTTAEGHDGPGELDLFGLFHGADERVPVESLAFLARVTARMLAEA